MSEAHRAVIARLYAEVVQGGDLDVLPALLHEDYTGRLADMPAPVAGRAAFADFVAQLHARMADVRAEVLQVVLEGDAAAVTWLTEGRERATGATSCVIGMSFYRFRDGKLASGRSLRTEIPGRAYLGL